jgi:elongator complex protein 2
LVEDICWEPEQKFFITTSKDQTTRFHGVWRSSGSDTWNELGRPQIHGYDLKCCAFLDRFKFVSGADEKLLRVFEAPKIFLNNLYNQCLDESFLKLAIESKTMAQGASVPALGLSNKAVYCEETKVENSENEKRSLADELYKEIYFNVIDLTSKINLT